MTAKEKAKELVQVYFNEVSDANPLEDILVSAKRCALICVDEMIGNYEEKYKYCKSKQFLKEVKQEIKKL
tara:strand:+ start:236 stop:445 length:210 start_codon:yes stop_codon:yes gene_type:complete